MPALDPPLVVVFIWIIGCVLVTFRLLVRKPPQLPGLDYALAAAFLVRVIPAVILPRGAQYETYQFSLAAQATLEGQSVYLDKIAYPYLPFQVYWFAAAYWLTDHAGLTFPFWLKVPGILAETAMTGLVYAAIRRNKNEDEAVFGSWIYAANPVTILVVAYQGQFDAIPLFLMAAAWYVVEFHSNRKWALELSAMILGLGILSKTWPILILPIILLRLPSWKLRLRYAAVAVAVPAAGTLFYEALFRGSLGAILKRSINVGAVPGWWGYSAILNVVVELTGSGSELYAWAASTGKLVALIGGALVICLTRHQSALASLVLTILTLFALVPNLGLQGLSWIVPFAVIVGLSAELAWYLAGATLHMLISYWGIHLTDGLYVLMPATSADVIIQLSSLTAWGVVVVWCAREIRRKRPVLFQEFAIW